MEALLTVKPLSSPRIIFMLPGAIATKQEDANSHKRRKQIGENAMLEAQEQLNRQHTLRSDPQRGAVLFVLRSADCAYVQWRREK